jgi:hypothetical protein
MAQQQFHLRKWIADGARGVSSRLFKRRCLPAAFWEHGRAASRESLLAARSLLDAVIERTESKPKRVTKVRASKAE